MPPAYRLVAFDTVSSTQDEARRLAREGAEDGTIVWARQQNAGRGRRGNGWTSPQGNLYTSLIVRPDAVASDVAQLSFVTAVALGDALGTVLPPMAQRAYKWPNDLLVEDRKIAGILLESEIGADGSVEWLIIGTGVNVEHYPSETVGRLEATSVHALGAPSVSVEEVLETYARHMLAWIDRWLDEGFAPIRSAWMRHAYGLGKEIEARLQARAVTGTFQGIDQAGALVLKLGDGSSVTIAAGEIYFQYGEDHAAGD